MSKFNICECGHKKPVFMSVNEVLYDEPKFRVVCPKCRTSSDTFKTRNKALNDWNTWNISNVDEVPIQNNKEIFNSAISIFGEESQINMAIEEAGELITALSKRGRKHNGSNIQHIINEMVDMQIMLEQLKIIFDDEKMFDEKMQEKMLRLNKIIELEKIMGKNHE
jgi:hypothetical protein